MGEAVHDVSFADSWRIQHNGHLIHADDVRLQGNVTKFGAQAATLSGHLAFASLCYAGPEDSETLDMLADGARHIISDHPDCSAGVSSFNGKVLLRLSAPNGLMLRALLIPLIAHLRTGEPLPRVWTT